MSKKNLMYLKDINKAIESITIFIQGMNFEQFKNDDKTSSAVIRKFEIIGEATKKIPREIYSNSMERYCGNERQVNSCLF